MIQERIEAFLVKHSDTPFCAACLAREAGTDAPTARTVLWRLRALGGYVMKGGRCKGCGLSKRTLRYVGGIATSSSVSDIVVFLVGHQDIHLCHACVALATRVSLLQVRDFVESVVRLREFEASSSRECAVCRRQTVTITTAGINLDDARFTRTTSHDGWRIDLLSYRVHDGWRPFVMVRGRQRSGRGTPPPDVLPVLCATRQYADDHALLAAKSWIDVGAASSIISSVEAEMTSVTPRLDKKINAKVDAGTLPTERPEKLFAGFGDDEACSVCDTPILRTQVQWSIGSGDDVSHRFHIGCHALWIAALRKRRLLRPPHRSPLELVTVALRRYAAGLCRSCLSRVTMLADDTVDAVLRELGEDKPGIPGICPNCGEDRRLVRS